MLVLSRKVGERIHIGEDIFVEVRRIAGNRVTIAIEAPREVRILRGELKESADPCDVLQDECNSESTKDTVIMKHPEQNLPSSQKQESPSEVDISANS